MARVLAVALMACLGQPDAVHGLDLFVDQAVGDDSFDGTTWATARASIASAIDTAGASPERDVIHVAAGTYERSIDVPADVILLGGFPSGGGTRNPGVHRTVIDGGDMPQSRFAGPPLVEFGAGSDRAMIDGFTIRRGGLDPSNPGVDGGAVRIVDSAPLVRDNVLEDSHACHGAGIAILYTTARSAYARVEGNVILRGSGPGRDCGIPVPGAQSICHGAYVRAPAGVDLGAILSGNRFDDNWGHGICIWASATVEHEVLVSNPVGLWLRTGPTRVNDVAAIGSARGIVVDCGGNFEFRNVTVAGGTGPGLSNDRTTGPLTAVIEDSILWGNVAGAFDVTCDDMPTVATSIVQGGFPGGTDILDVDPQFVVGPLGPHYLSQTDAGQLTTSPAVDRGSRLASETGLDQRTTATNSMPDLGAVDLGYHYPQLPPLDVSRGSTPDGLAPHRTVAALPFIDDPGTLSDPATPLLYYRVDSREQDVLVVKDLGFDSVRLLPVPSP